MLAFAKSDIGLVRPINEDSFACISPDFYVVADGMGGHLAGEIASQLAVETIKKIILHNETDSTDFTQLLKHAINTANKEILAKANLTSTTLAKMSKDLPVSMDVLGRICKALNVNIGDIVDYVDDDTSN